MGTIEILELKQKLDEYVNSFTNEKQKDKYIGCNVIDTAKFIYENNTFYNYLKYSFIAKHYERILDLIKWLIYMSFIGILIALFSFLGLNWISGILCIIILIIMFFITKILNTGESYKSYYNRTFLNLILNSFNNISFTLNTSRELNEGEIDSIINALYNKNTTSNNLDFISSICNGNICDLKLVHEKQRTNKNGTITKSTENVFDGFYIKINLNKSFNKLKGNTIKIKADESLFSSLTEDTVKGVYESDLEFNFNSEEMNKSFDCKVTGYSGFADVDDMMLEVQKIITPSFEQHLLYLRERFNTFNMNLNDSSITLSFHMKRDLFQKAKHGELLDFTSSYREVNKKIKILKADTTGISDFAYYNVFPFMERLYLINYLTYLYLSSLDFKNYYDINNNSINSYEEQMKSICEMSIKDFRKLYTDKIEKVKKETKQNLKEIKVEEK